MVKRNCRYGLITGLVIIILLGAAGSAQPAAEPYFVTEQTDITTDNWVGKVFVVLPLEQDSKAQGYTAFQVLSPVAGLLNGQGNIRAEWLEGRKLEVVAVQGKTLVQRDPPVYNYEVTFRDTDSGVTLAAKASAGQVPQVVRYDDLINAKNYFTGKTIFVTGRAIANYSPQPGSLTVTIDQPLHVDEVVPGISASEPIWLVVSTATGQRGYVPIAFSNTNLFPSVAQAAKPWQEALLETNPRQIYLWPDSIWSEINAGTVCSGMLPDQVRLAWGQPQSIRQGAGPDEELWYYPGKVLRFTARGLAVVQDR